MKEGNATSDNSLQVMVIRNDDELSETEAGNTFTVDSDHGATIQNIHSIGFTWLSNDTLQIDHDRKLRVFIQKEKIDGVTILYRPR